MISSTTLITFTASRWTVEVLFGQITCDAKCSVVSIMLDRSNGKITNSVVERSLTGAASQLATGELEAPPPWFKDYSGTSLAATPALYDYFINVYLPCRLSHYNKFPNLEPSRVNQTNQISQFSPIFFSFCFLVQSLCCSLHSDIHFLVWDSGIRSRARGHRGLGTWVVWSNSRPLPVLSSTLCVAMQIHRTL